jgi:SAM-dependent methyltransferase
MGATMIDALKPAAKRAVSATLAMLPGSARRTFKARHELRYWRDVIAPIRSDERRLDHERSHYEYFFTRFFGLSLADYAGRAVLDIGCGPMGSLSWAKGAYRVGLDPLVGQYRSLLDADHEMIYCEASAESIPFPDKTFDIVSTFNNLDHVDDVETTISEIKRVTAPGGRLLLIVEIGHVPTPTEPHELDVGIVNRFRPEFAVQNIRLFGVRPDHNLYASLRDGIQYQSGEPGVVAARLQRNP